MPKHYKGYGWIQVFKYAVFGLTLMFLGTLIGKAVADEEVFLDEAQAIYMYAGIFDNTALLAPVRGDDGNGMAAIDLHGTIVTVVVFPDCAQLIIDVPETGTQLLGCAQNVIVHNEED